MKILARLFFSLSIVLVGCGGGSSATDGTTENPSTGTPVSSGAGSGATSAAVTPNLAGSSTDTPAPRQLVGTAATGAAVTGARVEITGTDKNSVCFETAIQTDGVGGYTCNLIPGKTAPFFIVVTDLSGNTAALVSIATSDPKPGTPLTINVTPLTTAIVAQLNGGDALGVVSNTAIYEVDKLNAIKSNVLSQIKATLTSIGAPTDYDPFTTSITAATVGQAGSAGIQGNTADLVLDVIKITRDANGKPALSTIADPTPVSMSTDTTKGASMAAPPTAVTDLSKGSFALAQALNACYALPAAKRATVANGLIVDRAAECKNLLTSSDNPKGAPAFLNNGYNANEANYNSLTDDSMTGAKFSVPEIIAFYPKNNTNARDKAVANIRFVDGKGVAANAMVQLQNFPNSSTAAFPSNWWITGNQSKYDLGLEPEIRKVKDWRYADGDTYQSGFHFLINADTSAPLSDTFNIVLVTGRGLPNNGLWMVRSVSGYTGSFVVAKSRAATPQPLSALEQNCNDCDGFWMTHTAGITGTSASTLKVYSGGYTSARKIEGSYDGTNESSRPLKGDVYTFSLYKDTKLVDTDTRVLLDDVTLATNMQYLPWHGIGPNTAALFDINNTKLNGPLTSALLDWIINPVAEPIFNYWFTRADGNAGSSTRIVLGDDRVLAKPDGVNNQYTALTGPVSYSTRPLGGFRNVGFVYRTTNGTKKVSVNYYFP